MQVSNSITLRRRAFRAMQRYEDKVYQNKKHLAQRAYDRYALLRQRYLALEDAM